MIVLRAPNLVVTYNIIVFFSCLIDVIEVLGMQCILGLWDLNVF